VCEYIYIGNNFTDARYRFAICGALRRSDGKCIRGRNGNMLVSFGGKPVFVVARLLRKTSDQDDDLLNHFPIGNPI
jgi:hypothetical protein